MNDGLRTSQGDALLRDSTWLDRARELLNAKDPSDVDVATAICFLKADLGDMSPAEIAEMEESLAESERGPDCICPPELVARGGFKGGCPVHG